MVTALLDLHFDVKFNYRFKFLKSFLPDSRIEQQRRLATEPYCHAIT